MNNDNTPDAARPAAPRIRSYVAAGLGFGMAGGIVLAWLVGLSTAWGLSFGMFTGALGGVVFDPARSRRERWVAGGFWCGVSAAILLVWLTTPFAT